MNAIEEENKRLRKIITTIKIFDDTLTFNTDFRRFTKELLNKTKDLE